MKKLISLFVISVLSLDLNALPVSPYYVVADDYITPNLTNEHEQALVDFKNIANKVGYQGSWQFYSFDDGRHVAFSAKNQHDYEKEDGEAWQLVADKFPAEFLQSNGEIYKETISNQNFYMMRYLKDISYNDTTKEQRPSKYLVWLELQLHRTPIKSQLIKWKQSLNEQKSDLKFSMYSKQYGANLPTVFVVFHIDSIDNFYKMMGKKGIHDPLRLFPRGVYSAIKKYHISLGKYVPEISY